MSNLFWGMQFAPFSHKTALDERSSSISLVSRENGAKPHRHYFDCRFVLCTNLSKKFNQKSLLKFLLLFAFAKSKIPLNSINSNQSSIDSNFALDLKSIRATNRNGRDCGGGFVFVRIFGRETRLGVCERPKILTSAKDAPKSELIRNAHHLRRF